MALERTAIQAELKKRGLTETNADFMTFETEVQMHSFLDSITPKTYKTYDEILADEKLKPLALQYGDKRVGDAKSKWEKDNPKPGSTTEPDKLAETIQKAVEAAVKPLQDKVTSIENKKKTEERTAKIMGLIKDEFPEEVHELVMKSIPDDADDAGITKLIADHKANFTKLGLKGIGVPGQSGGAGGGAATEDIKNWGDKKKEKKEKEKEKITKK